MYEEPKNVWEALKNCWEMPQFTQYGQYIIYALLFLMAVYFALTRFTKLKKLFTLKTYVYSTLLGCIAGVGVHAAFLSVITSVSQETNLKYPIELMVHSLVLVATFCMFWGFIYLYFSHRAKNKSGWGIFSDVIYALMILPGASTVYYFAFYFIECAYNFYK